MAFILALYMSVVRAIGATESVFPPGRGSGVGRRFVASSMGLTR